MTLRESSERLDAYSPPMTHTYIEDHLLELARQRTRKRPGLTGQPVVQCKQTQPFTGLHSIGVRLEVLAFRYWCTRNRSRAIILQATRELFSPMIDTHTC